MCGVPCDIQYLIQCALGCCIVMPVWWWADLSLFLMLCMAFVVAVPVSQLGASPRKGSKLLLWWMCVCAWLDCSSFMAEVMVVLPELYMSLMLDSSSWSADSSWVGADGCWSKDQSSYCVLLNCLLKVLQWCSKFPTEMCSNNPGSVEWDMLIGLVEK